MGSIDGNTGALQPSEDDDVASAVKDPRRSATTTVGAHAAVSTAGALKTPKGFSRPEDVVPEQVVSPAADDEVDMEDSAAESPPSPQANHQQYTNNDIDQSDHQPPPEEKHVHLVEANLVVEEDTDTDSQKQSPSTLPPAYEDLSLQLAEIVEPEDTPVNKCIPKTIAAKLFCFGLAILVTAIVVTSIICRSGSCSAEPTNGGTGGLVESQNADPFSPIPTTTQPSLRPTTEPTNAPTAAPSFCPTIQPTNPPTAAPTTPLFNLPNFTLQAMRSDPQSSQSKAYRWLLENIHIYEALASNDTSDSVHTLDQWRLDQLFALATIYYSFYGDDWSEVNRQQWLDPIVHECNWTPTDLQISCQQGRLAEFKADSFILPFVGTLPAELVMLSSMTSFKIRESGLKGTLDDFLPHNFADLSDRLTYLTFYWSHLEGTIPGNVIGSLTNLRGLQLAAANIRGPIPTQMAALTDLRYLILNDNNYNAGLSGTLPTEVLAAITGLGQLRVDDNLLTGTLPTQLGLMTAIWDLWLHDNDFH